MSLFPISYVSAETGINPITLRAWENRYKLIVPTRTPSGHRLYSSQDIERIKRVIYLKSKGYRMSEMNSLLNRYPDIYNRQIQQNIPELIQFTKTFKANALYEGILKLLSNFNIEEFADEVYPIILDKMKQALWQNSIYFTQHRCFFFDRLRAALQSYFDKFEQDIDNLHIKIIGYEAPKEISEFYVNNLFLAILCSQYHLNTCLINHIDLFEEILVTAKNNPYVLHICVLGNDAYQFQQCINVLMHENLHNLLFYHPALTIDQLTSKQTQVVLPTKHSKMIGFINRYISLLKG